MGTASNIFLSELENCIDGAIADAALRAAGGHVSYGLARDRRQRALEAFPAAVCEVIAEKFKAHLPGLSGPAVGLTKLLIKLLREEPRESPYE